MVLSIYKTVVCNFRSALCCLIDRAFSDHFAEKVPPKWLICGATVAQLLNKFASPVTSTTRTKQPQLWQMIYTAFIHPFPAVTDQGIGTTM